MSSESDKVNTIGVGVIGFGFMGCTHAKAYQHAQRDGYSCRLIGIADSADRLSEKKQADVGNIEGPESEIDYSDITFSENAQALIERNDIDLVSVCTHTDTHVDLATAAIRAGKHVLVEKPIAINPDAVRSLAQIASESDRVCVPAMCMRFWPAWVRIREIIQSNKHGPVRSAVFHRLGTRPNWAVDFYSDESRSGGVLYDLHIHDTDFIVHCFGVPDSVATTGDSLHLSTVYSFSDGPMHVLAHGAWDHQPAVGFQMKCSIVCEDATIDFDINRDDQLIVYTGDTSTPIELGSQTGYDGEVRYVLDLIAGNASALTTPMNDAAVVAAVLDAQNKSMASGTKISLTI
jgi:predicted dehydrogenase